MSSELEPDLPVMLSRLSSIDCAADYIDNLIKRLALCVSLGVGELGGDLDLLLAAVASACVTFKSAARRLCSHRLQWLEKECEELDGVEKALLACARLCECSGVDWDELAASVAPSLHLVECDIFPRQSCVMDVDMCAVVSVRDALSRCSGVVDGTGCVGRGAELAWIDPSDSESAFQHNALALECFYSTGDAIRSGVHCCAAARTMVYSLHCLPLCCAAGGTGVDVADFSLSLSPSPHSRAMFAIEGSTLILRFTLNAPVAPGDAVTVDVLYLDRPFFRTQSKVRHLRFVCIAVILTGACTSPGGAVCVRQLDRHDSLGDIQKELWGCCLT